MKIWNLDDFVCEFEETLPPDSFAVAVFFSPIGYKNKVLLGSIQGPLSLWNLEKRKQIFWFRGFGTSVSAIQQAPAKNVVAIGLSDGRVVIHDIRFDKTLLIFEQSLGAITSIVFESASFAKSTDPYECLVDDENAEIFMVTGSAEGALATWQLKEDGQSRPIHTKQELHFNEIVSLHHIPVTEKQLGASAQAIVSQGADNSLKVCVFDRPDGSPRIAHQRSGHFRPPNRIEFWPGGSACGHLLVTAGLDGQLRAFSSTNARYDRHLGDLFPRPSHEKTKRHRALAPVVGLAMSAGRAERWDSMALIHEQRAAVSTWDFMKGSRGKHSLHSSSVNPKLAIARAVYVTRCGHFALVGYSDGQLVKFNMQSGETRGEYRQEGKKSAHDGAILAVSSNVTNSMVISLGATSLKFWKFERGDLLTTVALVGEATKASFQVEANLVAVAERSGAVLVVDTVHKRPIRHLPALGTQAVAEMQFSCDAKWLVCAYNGPPTVRTWDLLDGQLIDSFCVSVPVTAMAFSPDNTFLATTHENFLGVILWDNQATYRRLTLTPMPLPFHVTDGGLSYSQSQDMTDQEKPCYSTYINIKVRRCVDLDSVDKSDGEEEDEILTLEKTSAPFTQPVGDSEAVNKAGPAASSGTETHLLKLSKHNPAFFSSLLQRDSIRQRNEAALKPAFSTEEPKTRAMPFFLPLKETTEGVKARESSTWFDEESDDETRADKRRASKAAEAVLVDQEGLLRLLKDVTDETDRKVVSEQLNELPSRSLELLIHTLVSEETKLSLQKGELANCDFKVLIGFLNYLRLCFETGMDFNLANSMLKLLLLTHGECLALLEPSDAAADLLRQVVEAKRSSQQKVLEFVDRSLCMTDFVRHPISMLKF